MYHKDYSLTLYSKVNARWLTDLDTFNEWMNEEDYEVTDAQGSQLVREFSQTDLCMLVVYSSDQRRWIH